MAKKLPPSGDAALPRGVQMQHLPEALVCEPESIKPLFHMGKYLRALRRARTALMQRPHAFDETRALSFADEPLAGTASSPPDGFRGGPHGSPRHHRALAHGRRSDENTRAAHLAYGAGRSADQERSSCRLNRYPIEFRSD